MPRQARSDIQSSFFHVMTQGINKTNIFEHDLEIKTYIKYMYELKADHNIKIIAYCIMNNHAHILIHTDKVNNLSEYMKRLNGKYAMFYNKIHNKCGFVFRNRFRSEGIYSKRQLENCINYIFNNPVKANICKSPEEYLYSNYNTISYKYNLNSSYKYDFLDIEEDKVKVFYEILNKFLTTNNISIDDLRKDKKKLRVLLILLRDKYKIPWKTIQSTLDIGRETLRNIYK